MRLFQSFFVACLTMTAAFATGNDPGLANSWNADNQQHFIENKGQVYNLSDNTPNPEVRFMLERPGMKVFLMNSGISTQFEQMHYPAGYQELMQDVNKEPGQEQQLDELQKEVRLETWRVDMRLLGANPSPNITTEGKSEDYTHYYNRDVLFVHHFQKVTYHDVYPGIDWVVYTQEGGMKYDFIVHPGADPGQIRMQYTHQESLELDAKGNLNVYTGMGLFTEQTPVSFQGGKFVQTSFKKEGDVIRFNLDSFDHTKTLIIDPLVRLWGTYYGGSALDEIGYSTTTDTTGNVFLAGRTNGTTAIAALGHQNTYGGGTYDAFLVKFNASGIRQWGTYYGGSSEEYGTDVATDQNGNIYLVGITASTTSIAFSGHQNTFGGGTMDGYIAKFNSSGSRIWASYYGGTNDDFINGIAVDSVGNIYFSGYTSSTNSIALGGHQNIYGGGSWDAFIVKFNNSGIRQWGSYYGGNLLDIGNFCEVDKLGNVYLAGSTQSTASIAFSGHQNIHGGLNDGFLVKLNNLGIRQWATYYGGSSNDYGLDIVVDYYGNIYFCGYTRSLSNISFLGHQNVYGGGTNDAFIVKFNSIGVRKWGTYYGGSDDDEAIRATLDKNDNVLITGITKSTDSIAFKGYQNIYGGGGWDAFSAKFDSSGYRVWGSYYGGTADDVGRSINTDQDGNVYFAGNTFSSNDIAIGGHQNTLGGGSDAFLVKFYDCNASFSSTSISSCGAYLWPVNGVSYNTSGTYMDTLVNAAGCDSIITLNLTVTNVDTSVNLVSGTLIAFPGYSYQWLNCGSGYSIISGATNQIYTPSLPGSYAVQVTNGICVDTSACHSVAVVSLNPYSERNVHIFPNPAHQQVTISGLSERNTLTLWNTLGQVVLEANTSGSEHTLNLSGLPAGVYTLQVSSEAGTAFRKLVVE